MVLRGHRVSQERPGLRVTRAMLVHKVKLAQRALKACQARLGQPGLRAIRAILEQQGPKEILETKAHKVK
jgi:hypothetical protein